MSEQKFGGVWTEQKLDAVESYLKAYTTLMKNQKFKLIYIDAFAGSGTVKINKEHHDNQQVTLIDDDLNNEQKIDGSALRALKYPFNVFKFFEKDKNYHSVLSDKIKENYWNKQAEVKNEDCNELLMKINNKNWYKDNWRGVIFLDPYAMNLSWECLEEISKTQIFDVWYLFPFMALNRNLFKNLEDIPQDNRNAITRILGTSDWENELYKKSSQINIFGEEYDEVEKVSIQKTKQYVIKRLESIFKVSSESLLLRNSTNSPQFLLCFMCSNKTKKAGEVSLRVASHILKHADMERV